MRYGPFAALLLLASCENPAPPAPVVVFAAGTEGGRLADVLVAASAETGLALDIRWGDSGELTERLVAKTGEPADLLVTDNVADIWHAADRGALRPIQSDAFEAQQDFLRDAERLWAAIGVSFHAIYHGPGVRPVTAGLDDLATPQFKGRVCLSSARLGINRSLISYLIEERGPRTAERLVRLWVRNLARPPFATQQALIEAVRGGECDYGVGGRGEDADGVVAFGIDPHFIDIEAVGIGRHARNADAAQAMVDWLLRHRVIEFRSMDERYPPAVHIAGYRDEEARLLAERAGYR